MKRIITAALIAIIIIGMMAPTAFAAKIGVLDYSVSTNNVALTKEGDGSFTITVPKPAVFDKYAGVEFEVQLSAGVTITSVSYSIRDVGTTGPKLLPSSPGKDIYFFSCSVLTVNTLTANLTCTVNVSYKGTGAASFTVNEITLYAIDPPHDLSSFVSEKTTKINLTPFGGVIGGDPGGGNQGGGDPGGGTTVDTPDIPTTDPDLPGAVFPFTDVLETNWFYENVYYMWKNKLMNGISATLFDPYASLTRGMVVTVLYRMKGAPDVSGLAMPFSDVAEGVWYSDAIKWAEKNDIARGLGGGIFRPNDNVTREQMAAFIFRYAEYAETAIPEIIDYADFADQAEISEWAVEAVEALFMAEVIRGKENNRFDPKGFATRAEFAAMLNRFLESGE